MKYMFSLLIVLMFTTTLAQAQTAACTPPPKVELKAGSKVVAQWQGNNWWVAKIDAVKGEFYEITYSDNTKGIKKAAEIVAHPEVLYTGTTKPCIKAGDKVVSAWRGDSWWTATVDKVTEDIAEITYSDGEKGLHHLNEMVPANP